MCVRVRQVLSLDGKATLGTLTLTLIAHKALAGLEAASDAGALVVKVHELSLPRPPKKGAKRLRFVARGAAIGLYCCLRVGSNSLL